MSERSGEHEDPLTSAYEQRSAQLYEARGALAEAVSALTVELDQRREELASVRAELAAAGEYSRSLRDYVARLETELRAMVELVETLRNMKVVRWTRWPRSVVYRLRGRG